MKTTKEILLPAILLFALTANAQNYYYPTFDDLKAGQGQETNAELQRISIRKLKKTVKAPYKLKCKNLKEATTIKKKARFISVGNELFLNCRGIDFYCNGHCEKKYRGKRFVPCHMLGDNQIVFTMADFGSSAARMIPSTADYVVDGIITLLTHREDMVEDTFNDELFYKEVRRAAAKQKACYLMKNDGRNKAEKIDAPTMRLLLDTRLDLIEEYNKVNPQLQEAPEVIISYLRRCGKI